MVAAEPLGRLERCSPPKLEEPRVVLSERQPLAGCLRFARASRRAWLFPQCRERDRDSRYRCLAAMRCHAEVDPELSALRRVAALLQQPRRSLLPFGL